MNILKSAMDFPVANRCDLHVLSEGMNLVWVWDGQEKGTYLINQ